MSLPNKPFSYLSILKSPSIRPPCLSSNSSNTRDLIPRSTYFCTTSQTPIVLCHATFYHSATRWFSLFRCIPNESCVKISLVDAHYIIRHCRHQFCYDCSPYKASLLHLIISSHSRLLCTSYEGV